MNSNLKNAAVVVGSVAVLALAFAAVSYVNSYGKSIQPSSFRSFSVTGEGKSVSIPDIARFSFQVVTEGGKDLGALQKENTDKVNKVIAFVKDNGIDAKDIKTQSYNVNPRYTSYSCYESSPESSKPAAKVCPPPEITGYTVTQSVDVKIRNFAKIGDVMGGVVTNGANQVGSLSFTIDDPTKVQDDARAEAIVKAKVKAHAVAEAGGFRLGRLLGIQENGGYYPVAYKESYSLDSSMGRGGAAAPAPAIEPGSQETNVTVTMTYEIQ